MVSDSDPQVYLRDASWYANGRGGSSARYHWPSAHDEAISACGRVAIMSDAPGRFPDEIPANMRCRAPGCKKRYDCQARTPMAGPGQGETP